MSVISQFLIIILPILSSYIFASNLFKKINIIDKLNITFLFLTCQLVLIAETLSLLNNLNAVNFLISTVILFLASFLRSDNITGWGRCDYKQIKLAEKSLIRQVKKSRLLAFFLLVILLSLLWRIFLIIYVPQNNWDGMAAHLSRVAYWLQNGSFRHYATQHNPQIAYPFNAQILLLWTMIASRADSLTGFIQLIAYLLSGTLVYRCLRQYLKIDMLASTFVAFIWYSMPLVVLESTSVQNDLVVSYFIMFCLVYFLLSISGNGKFLYLSAIALAVAAGTKVNALFFIPLFPVVILGFIVRRRIRIKQAFFWAAVFFISWVILGAYSYLQNYIMFKAPLAQKDWTVYIMVNAPSVRTFSSNIFQHLFNIAANQSGLQFYISGLSNYYNLFTAKIGTSLLELFRIPMNAAIRQNYSVFSFDDWQSKFSLCEDRAFFGAVGMLMLLLFSYIILMSALKVSFKNVRFNFKYLVFAFLPIGYLSFLSYFQMWNFFAGRLIITAILIGTPALALVFNSKRPPLRIIKTIVIVYSIMLIIPATFTNQRKPLTLLPCYNSARVNFRRATSYRYWYRRIRSFAHKKGDTQIRIVDPWSRMRLRYISRPPMMPIIERFDTVVAPNSRVGVLLPRDSWDYPLFGERLTRKIVPLDLGILQNENFDFLLIVDRELIRERNKTLKEFIEANYEAVEELGREKLKDDLLIWVLYVPVSDKSSP